MKVGQEVSELQLSTPKREGGISVLNWGVTPPETSTGAFAIILRKLEGVLEDVAALREDLLAQQRNFDVANEKLEAQAVPPS
eukprot:gene13330-15751_t